MNSNLLEYAMGLSFFAIPGLAVGLWTILDLLDARKHKKALTRHWHAHHVVLCLGSLLLIPSVIVFHERIMGTWLAPGIPFVISVIYIIVGYWDFYHAFFPRTWPITSGSLLRVSLMYPLFEAAGGTCGLFITLLCAFSDIVPLRVAIGLCFFAYMFSVPWHYPRLYKRFLARAKARRTNC